MTKPTPGQCADINSVYRQCLPWCPPHTHTIFMAWRLLPCSGYPYWDHLTLPLHAAVSSKHASPFRCAEGAAELLSCCSFSIWELRPPNPLLCLCACHFFILLLLLVRVPGPKEWQEMLGGGRGIMACPLRKCRWMVLEDETKQNDIPGPSLDKHHGTQGAKAWLLGTLRGTHTLNTSCNRWTTLITRFASIKEQK